jgi:23S rRNA (guanosine2251-2'-O)-methyltransferase
MTMKKFDRQVPRKKTADNVIFGVRAVIEAIRAGRSINRIWIQKNMNKELFLDLKKELNGKDFALQFVPIEKINSLVQGNHQGVVADISPVEYGEIEPFVEQLLEEGVKPFILVLDRITDVRNFGAIARTAACQGVHALLIPDKGSALVTPDAVKTSAGALHHLPVCKTKNLKDSLFYLQQCGMRIVACTEKANVPLYEANLRGSVAVIMGSEESGIASDLINLADLKARIPMTGEIASLNVSVAAGMVLYEKTRQELRG